MHLLYRSRLRRVGVELAICERSGLADELTNALIIRVDTDNHRLWNELQDSLTPPPAFKAEENDPIRAVGARHPPPPRLACHLLLPQ